MKKGNLTKWSDIHSCTNLLLFSQLVNELLFDYSIPSNRVSTLNSHYLCLDAMSAIDSIENHGVPAVTLKPIMEELYYSLSKDPVFANLTISPLDYFLKYTNDSYISSKVSDMKYDDLKKTALSLSTCFFKDNQYFCNLKQLIRTIIVNNDLTKQNDLFRLVKSLLTELMNSGYSLKYIQDVMTKLFWNTGKTIKTPDVIDDFFASFDMEKKEYKVVFIIHKKRMERFLSYVNDVKLEESIPIKFNSHSEKQFLDNKNRDKRNAYLTMQITSYDAYSAANSARYRLEVDTSIYRLYDHNYRYSIKSAHCGVYSDSHFYKIDSSINAVEHARTMSNKQISDGMDLANKALESTVKTHSIDDLFSIINSARFHANSLNSESEENQLLDLWAIFESVLDISNEHTSDRIKQICMYLVPILKQNYIYSLFHQLAQDMKNYNDNLFQTIINNATTEDEIVQKICEFVILDDYQKEREKYLQQCIDFPLLKERIEYYSTSLKTTNSVYAYTEKHGEHVTWQIMRIYRNRNLIIHNAESMPYLGLLIENLHSYVDEFLSYAISCLAEDHNIESMCQELFIKECERKSQFQRGKTLMNKELITKILAL